MAAANKTTLIEEWGYSHMNPLASDTHVVCDWSNVVGMERPVCTRGTCAGHRADDLLPMGNFLGKNESYTNWEFYKFTSPFNDDLPYVYDSFTRWEGCLAQGLSFGETATATASPLADDTTAPAAQR